MTNQKIKSLLEEIFEKYKYEIPVVHINGKIAFKYQIDENEFIQKLEKRKF